MTTEELKYLEIPDLNKKYEVGVTTDVLNGALDLKADAIEETASGSIASFTDGADDVPMKSLVVNIEPKQSGSGDPSPSNIRPISGWDEVEVVRCGKNVAHISDEIINNDRVIDGLTFHALTPCEVRLTGTPRNVVYMTTGYAADNTYLRLLKAGTYTLSSNIPSSIGGVYVTGYPVGGGSSATLINSTTDGSPKTVTLSQDYMANIQMVVFASSTAINKDVWIQLEEGSTATTYEPYQAETKTITLPSTVYGGTLDVVSGEGESTMGMVDLGTLDWRKTTNATKTYFQTTAEVADMKKSTSVSVLQGLICSQYVENTWTKVLDSAGYDNSIAEGWGNKSLLVVYDSSKTNMTDAEFKSAMSGVKLVYSLATPTDFNTTPTEVKSLLGSNNIWSDAGTVEVTYRADTTLAYNKLLSLIANS